MLKLNTLIAVCAVAGFALNHGEVRAEMDRLSEIAKTKTIVFGHQSQSIPFSFVNTNGQVMGYSVDLCLRVAEEIQQNLNIEHLDVKWVQLTQENRFNMVATGQVDAECGSTTMTATRMDLVDFSLMTWIDGANFVTQAGSPIHDIKALNHRNVGVIKGNSTESALKSFADKSGVSLSIVPITSHAEGIAMLRNGHIDAYAADQTILLGLMSTYQREVRLSMAKTAFSYEPYAFMVRPNQRGLRNEINKALAKIYRTKEIDGIYAKWFGKIGRPTESLSALYNINAIPH